MSIKLGLKAKRKKILEAEIEKIKSRIPALDVQKVILFGSLATQTVSKSSDIDLIIVKRTDRKFLDRMDEFYQKLDPRVSLDIMVYTPEEFDKMTQTSSFIKRAIRVGKILYEAK
jgi:predicted nucleotidyltransferase